MVRVATDLAIEQRLMRAVKGQMGLAHGGFRKTDNAYGVVTPTSCYTTLMRCMKLTHNRPIIIKFDYPLRIKAVEISISMKLPVVVKLGGFHLLKSYLGSIGFIMDGSGIEDLVKEIYPDIGDSTVSHNLSGAAYYKALNCHFLLDAAMILYLIQDSVVDLGGRQ